MQADGIKDFINIAEGMVTADLPAMLPVLRADTGAAFSPPGRTSERTKTSEEMPVTVEQQLHLAVNGWDRRIQVGDIPSYQWTHHLV